MAGKISSFDLDEQGFFLTLCNVAWTSLGPFDICSTSVERRFKKSRQWVTSTVQAFVDTGIVTTDGEKYHIKFIDEQIEELLEVRKKKQDAGKASAAARKLAKETSPLHPPKEINTKDNTIQEKRREACSTVLNTSSTGVEHVLEEKQDKPLVNHKNGHDDALELSRSILCRISASKNRRLTSKPESKSIIALIKAGNTTEEINQVVDWLCRRYEESTPYTPEVQSTRALYEKWDKIKSAMEREASGGNNNRGKSDGGSGITENIKPRLLL